MRDERREVVAEEPEVVEGGIAGEDDGPALRNAADLAKPMLTTDSASPSALRIRRAIRGSSSRVAP
jgi:hypothetical protein